MRIRLLAEGMVLLALSVVLSACSSDGCLPEPDGDPSPPEVRITASITLPSGETRTVIHGIGDPPRAVEVSPSAEVVITYVAVDSLGVRSLAPGLTIQQTVGVGVERRYVEIDPIVASCPRARLAHRQDVPGGRSPRSVLATIVAENWSGATRTLEPFTVRYR